MYLVGVSCILMYLVQYQLFFSFPVVPHKPVLLHQKCPEGYYAVRQVLVIGQRKLCSRRRGPMPVADTFLGELF